MNAMDNTTRQDNSESHEYSRNDLATFSRRRPDETYVQEMIAKSKAMYRERLAKVVRRRRRTSDQLVATSS